MKTRQSYTTTYFIIGIIIGLAIAIMYSLKNKNDIKNKNTESNIPIESIDIDTVTKDTIKLEIKEIPTTPKKKAIVTTKKKEISKTAIDSVYPPNIDSNIQDSGAQIVPQIDSIAIIDSVVIDTNSTVVEIDSTATELKDSIEFELLEIDNSNSQEISISKDELIYSSLIYPKGKRSNFACNTINKYDSLLVNNIQSKKEGLYVEIWQSPINLVGYKLTTNTLILYGIYEYNKIKLRYTENGAIELKYKNNTLLLECTDSFKSLIIK